MLICLQSTQKYLRENHSWNWQCSRYGLGKHPVPLLENDRAWASKVDTATSWDYNSDKQTLIDNIFSIFAPGLLFLTHLQAVTHHKTLLEPFVNASVTVSLRLLCIPDVSSSLSKNLKDTFPVYFKLCRTFRTSEKSWGWRRVLLRWRTRKVSRHDPNELKISIIFNIKYDSDWAAVHVSWEKTSQCLENRQLPILSGFQRRKIKTVTHRNWQNYQRRNHLNYTIMRRRSTS